MFSLLFLAHLAIMEVEAPLYIIVVLFICNMRGGRSFDIFCQTFLAGNFLPSKKIYNAVLMMDLIVWLPPKREK